MSIDSHRSAGCHPKTHKPRSLNRNLPRKPLAPLVDLFTWRDMVEAKAARAAARVEATPPADVDPARELTETDLTEAERQLMRRTGLSARLTRVVAEQQRIGAQGDRD